MYQGARQSCFTAGTRDVPRRSHNAPANPAVLHRKKERNRLIVHAHGAFQIARDSARRATFHDPEQPFLIGAKERARRGKRWFHTAPFRTRDSCKATSLLQFHLSEMMPKIEVRFLRP